MLVLSASNILSSSLLFVVNCHQNCPDFCSHQYLNLHPTFPKFLFPKSFKDLTKQHLTSTTKIQFVPPKKPWSSTKIKIPPQKHRVCAFFWGKMGCHWIFHAPFPWPTWPTSSDSKKGLRKNHCFTGSKCSPPKKRWLLQKNFSQQEVELELNSSRHVLYFGVGVGFVSFCFFVVVYYISFWSFGNIGLPSLLYISFWSFGIFRSAFIFVHLF